MDFNSGLTATYRLQLHKGFGFDDGARLARYLSDLGVSHVYASPIMAARAGSMHGYDVIDFERVNPELGGEEGLERLVTALHRVGLGLIVDIVPNHMAVGGSDNPWWLDLLQNGRASAYADFFDVDFDAPGMNGKILCPFLGAPYEDALRSGELEIRRRHDNGRYAVFYHEHCFPLRDVDQAPLDADGVDAFAKPPRLHELLQAQRYRLASWRTANDLINYRRFFEITTLAGIKIERAAAFERVHKFPLELYARGWIDGVRVDHIDGLTDPNGYCERLRDELAERRGSRPTERRQAAYIVVEKILAGHEHLPPFAVQGTTGYDFMNEVSAVQHQAAGAKALDGYWREVSGRTDDFDEEETLARRELLEINFCGQAESVVDSMMVCVRQLIKDRDLTRSAVRRAIKSTIAHLRVYRSYALGGAANPGPGPALEAAIAAALHEPTPDEQAIRALQSVMTSQSEQPAFVEAIRRFHQLTAPIAAKSVEDTAFYRYGRLLSRNDVGFDASTLSESNDEFHQRMAYRAVALPNSMLTTATHDHKRGEDVRARLAVLSEIAELWVKQCREWSEMNAELRSGGFDVADEYMLYQMIIGAWPFDLKPDDGVWLEDFASRLTAWQIKALREAKLRSSWLAPNAEYERIAEEFVKAVLNPERSADFLESAARFVAAVATAGIVNSLTQTALRCLVPGVPDLYRGCELWDFSLVDPDNRRPVDFDLRERLLAAPPEAVAPGHSDDDGASKQRLIQILLTLRRDAPELFARGSYRPLTVDGPGGEHVIAFQRESGGVSLIAAMLTKIGEPLLGSSRLTPEPEFWGEARLATPGGKYRCVFGAEGVGPGDRLAEVFAEQPVAVWVSGE